MGRPRAYLLLLLCLIHFFLPADAALPPTLSFQDNIEYSPARGVVTVRGKVVLTYEDGEIHADEAVYLWDEDLFLFAGDVIIIQDGQQITAAKAEYQAGQLTLAKAAVVKDELFLRADQVDVSKKLIFAKDGSLTTCDLASPHYQLAAQEVRIYPGDKIILKGAAYREGTTPLYYWPYLIIPLGEEFTLPVPQLGRGPGGLFLK
ncbi:MAG: LPS-assembly protein LptD, partial [Firmicutes bacterium]|nr:LPS-assembly protein LptD [Bacillota bacterium]